jgi:glyoxylase-like metal-dependent hydrolase (beta-lactamase superfamily II)
MKITTALAALALVGAGSPASGQYEIYGVRFGGYPTLPLNVLVLHEDSTRKQEIAFIVWALRPAGDTKHAVLFDAGFYRDKFLKVWKPTNFQRPSEAIAKIGLAPDAITDIIISHVHWDHLDGVDLFPRAKVWIQKAEYEHYVDDAGLPKAEAIDTADAAMLAQLKKAGRVMLIDGDGKEIIPGITVYTGGRHTYASQYVGVRTAKGTVVLASDNAYMYENLAKHVPIGATFTPGDTIANVAAQDRMRHLASDPKLILPGHDPEIFTRFPTPGSGVAKIE